MGGQHSGLEAAEVSRRGPGGLLGTARGSLLMETGLV